MTLSETGALGTPNPATLRRWPMHPDCRFALRFSRARGHEGRPVGARPRTGREGMGPGDA